MPTKHTDPLWPSLLVLALLAWILGLAEGLFKAHGLAIRDEALLLWRILFNTVLALWVRKDRQFRSYSAPYEFDAFMFFAWPVLLPYYLYRTRRITGLLLTFVVYLLAVLPTAVVDIARLLFGP